MRMMMARRLSPFGVGLTAAVAAVLVLAGCGLDEIKIPEMDGPAELGTSLRLTAVPDVITADGFSSQSCPGLIPEMISLWSSHRMCLGVRPESRAA